MGGRRRQPDQGCAGRRRDASQGIAFTAIRREAARRHLQTDKGNALQNLLTATAVIEAATGPVLVAHPSLPASRGVDRQRRRRSERLRAARDRTVALLQGDRRTT